MLPLLGLLVGLLVGLFLNINIPSAYSSYVAVAILAIIDAVFGAVIANMKGEFRARLFVTGFLGNAFAAVVMAALGDQLNLPLNLAAVFAFGNRIFVNVSALRRLLLEKYDRRKEEKISGRIGVDHEEEKML